MRCLPLQRSCAAAELIQAVLGRAVWSTVFLPRGTDLAAFGRTLTPRLPIRSVAGYALVLAVLNAAAWLKGILPAVVSDNPRAFPVLTETGQLTNPNLRWMTGWQGSLFCYAGRSALLVIQQLVQCELVRSKNRAGSWQGPDAALDRRCICLYAFGLVAIYLVGVAVILATHTPAGSQLGVLIIMFSPLAGALLARFAGQGVIRWGRLSWWMLAGLIPAVAVFGAYAVGSPFGVDVATYGVLGRALLLSPIIIVIASFEAVGEETGWRGFLWPLMRRRWSFLFSALVIGAVWWTYHAPLIIFGWYGSRSGLPAFTVALAGLTLFIGVLTDRSKAVWPSVIAHGAWNALPATGFAVAGNASLAVFAGSTFWVGEFGWLAAIASLATGSVATWWHLSRPMPEPLITPAAVKPAEQAPESSQELTFPATSGRA